MTSSTVNDLPRTGSGTSGTGGKFISRPTDVAARIGGDEFVVLCRGVAERSDLDAIVERVRVELARPYAFLGGWADGLALDLSASVGGALYKAGETEDAVMAIADRRMYEAKARR